MFLTTKVLFPLAISLVYIAQCDCGNVVGYWGSWSYYREGDGKFEISNIDTDLFTHLIYSFVGINEDGTIRIMDDWLDIQLKGYEKFTNLKQKKSGLKTLIAIGGWSEGSTKFSTVVTDGNLRKKFVQNVVQFLKKHKFDGLDVDWEYPAQRGGRKDDKKNYGLLLKELKDAFKSEKPQLILTVAVAPTKDSIKTSYDVKEIAKNVDFINLMTYDFHMGTETKTGHNSPLYRGPSDTTDYQRLLNDDTCVSDWISAGAPASKIVMGIPTYGRSFTLANPSNHGIGAPSTGQPGQPGPFTKEAGSLAYYEILKLQKEGGWGTEMDQTQKVPYTYKGNQWIGYDNPESAKTKVKYAKSKKLGGVMIWSIEQDDFRGLYGKHYPIISAIKNAM